MAHLKFKILRLFLTVVFCALVSWLCNEVFDIDGFLAFLVLLIGLPVAAWLERVKKAPGHILAAYLLHKELIDDTKARLRKLRIKKAEDWIDFQSFFDSDNEIEKYVSSEPKVFAACMKYSLQTLRDSGHFIDFLNSSTIWYQAIEKSYWDAANREKKEFVQSEGYESWAEYMVDNGTTEEVRESWKDQAKKEKKVNP